MTIGARGWVSVAELIVYIPSTIAAAIACYKHGFSRSSGWIYTLILSVVRVVGSICQLATYSNQSIGLIEATVIIDSIGISPLLLATLGMLSRLTDQINRDGRAQSFFKISHFRLTQLLITLGLILAIVGGTSSTINEDGSVTPATTSEVAVIIYIAAFFVLMLVLVVSLRRLSLVSQQESRVGFCILIAAPFILVRLIYSALSVFLHNADFNIIDGSVSLLVGMSVIEEFVVVFLYVALGFYTSKLSTEEQGPIETRPWRRPRN